MLVILPTTETSRNHDAKRRLIFGQSRDDSKSFHLRVSSPYRALGLTVPLHLIHSTIHNLYHNAE